MNLQVSEKVCGPCIEGKATRTPFKLTPRPRSRRVAELLHTDIAGPTKNCGLNGPRGGERGVAVVSGPAFSARQQAVVLARVGESAALRCNVVRLADRVVSWVRSSDLQILTHAGYVFTADARVSCAEAPAAGAPGAVLTSRDEGWQRAGSVHTLRIDHLRESDSGRYECQINTEPKLSLFFNLTVVESQLPTVSVRAVVEEGADGEGGAGGVVWGAVGGAAQLACEARYEPTPTPDVLGALPPLSIQWLHEGDSLDPQSARGGISLDTERWAARTVSRLTLAALGASDAGRYVCVAGERRAALRLRLHGIDDRDYEVLEGEIETMQRDQAVARVSAAVRRSLAPLCAWLALLLGLYLT
ncbi:unnamed protein product, partial [Brenthis ino]